MADNSSIELNHLTADLWQKRANRTLSEEDCRQIEENMSGFINILQEWERRESHAE